MSPRPSAASGDHPKAWLITEYENVIPWLANQTEAYVHLVQSKSKNTAGSSSSSKSHEDGPIELDNSQATLRELVCAGVLPLIRVCFRWGFVSVDHEAVRRICAAATVMLEMEGIFTPEEYRLMRAVAYAAEPSTSLGESLESIPMTQEEIWYNLVQIQWREYTEALSQTIGIASTTSGQIMGDGMRVLSLMLTQKEIPAVGREGDALIGHFGVYAACNHPLHKAGLRWSLNATTPPSSTAADYQVMEYRYVSHRISSLLTDEALELDSAFRSNLLALCRAMIHMDDPNNSEALQMQYGLKNPSRIVSDEEKLARWQRCIGGVSVHKSHPERETVH